MLDLLNRPLRLLLILLGAVGLPVFLLGPHFLQPWEDAVILFQYSTNLALTHTISFYPGGPHAEGATDFLWMALLAAGRLLGANIFFLADALSALSACLIAVVLLRIAGKRPDTLRVLLILGLIFLAPQTVAALGGFSVFPFALLLAATVWLLLKPRYDLACLAALLLCLFRPDGVVFALPLLAMFLFDGRLVRSRLGPLLGYFVAPGLLYFLWRWHYFGGLLPLPFLVKADTPHWHGLFVVDTLKHQYKTVLLTAFLIILGCGPALKTRTNLKLLVGLLVVPVLFYFRMRLDQDIAGRFFFFPLLAVGLLYAANWSIVAPRARILLPVGVALALLLFTRNYLFQAWSLFELRKMPEAAIATAMHRFPERGSMIVSEAGVIPFYSGWVAYDPWGLNTAQFARKIIQPADVAALNPDLIVVHRDDSQPCAPDPTWQLPYQLRGWDNMDRNLIAAASQGQYVEWLVPRIIPHMSHPFSRAPFDVEQGVVCWYIKPDSPERRQLESVLQQHGAIIKESPQR